MVRTIGPTNIKKVERITDQVVLEMTTKNPMQGLEFPSDDEVIEKIPF